MITLTASVLRYADQSGEAGEEYIVIHDTKDSKLRLASGMSNVLCTNATVKRAYEFNDDTGTFTVIYTVDAIAGQPITLHKYLAYVYAGTRGAPAALIETTARRSHAGARPHLRRVSRRPARLSGKSSGSRPISRSRAGTAIARSCCCNRSIHFNMFHLQAAGGPGKTNIGSKGLTSEGYEGHYFWDTEMFAAPFFQHVKRRSAAICSATATTSSPTRGREPERWPCRVRPMRGAPLTTKNARRITPGTGTAQYPHQRRYRLHDQVVRHGDGRHRFSAGSGCGDCV